MCDQCAESWVDERTCSRRGMLCATHEGLDTQVQLMTNCLHAMLISHEVKEQFTVVCAGQLIVNDYDYRSNMLLAVQRDNPVMLSRVVLMLALGRILLSPQDRCDSGFPPQI